MANEFGDEPSVKSSATVNEFGDEPAKPRKGYVAASLSAGLQDAKGIAATIGNTLVNTAQEVIVPGYLTPAQAEQKFKNDPAGFAANKAASTSAYFDSARNNAGAAAKEVMGRLTPEGQEIADKRYATTDANESALLSPTRIAGDAVRSLPTTAATLGSLFLTRGAGASAKAAAIAGGATEAVAQAAAVRAAAGTMALAGGVTEGAIGGAQAYGSTLQETEAADLTISPAYKYLIAQGYAPEVARAKISRQAAEQAGLGAGLVDAGVSAVGGAALGKIVQGGGSALARTGKGFGTEASTEGVQSPGEQIAENAAKKRYVDPGQDLLAGTGESMVAGAAVGGFTGAGFGLIGGVGHNPTEHANAAQNAANSIESEALTGMTPDAAKAVADIKPALVKPRLNAQQIRVGMAASAAGVDPNLALVVAQLESGGKIDAKNPNSTAQGLFQLLDKTWESVGGGDRADSETQIRNGVAYLSTVQATLEKSLGRKPGNEEIYMGHLLGPGGAKALINADGQNPQGMFIDTVRKYDAKNADAIVNNNALAGLTNEQAYQRISSKVGDARRRLGLDPAVNEMAQVTANSDKAPAVDEIAAQTLDEELDALLLSDEMLALTPEEEIEVERERTANPEVSVDLEHGAEIEAIDLENPPTPQTTLSDIPKLPPALRGASPRYGAGQQNYTLDFAEDVDRAAYIIADTAKQSKQDAEYLQFVMANTGMDESEARDYGKTIRAKVKAAAFAAEAGATGLRIETAPDNNRPDSFVSFEEAATRKRYPNPNDNTLVSQTPVSHSNNAEAIGTTLAERRIRPGEVLALNTDSRQYPEAYVVGVHSFLSDMTAKFMPDASVVATFRTLDPKFVAGYGQMTRAGTNSKYLKTGAQAVHQINVRNATGFGEGLDGSQNPTTKLKIAYSLAHEFGHALVEQEFRRGMSLPMEKKFDALGIEEFFTEEDLIGMPAPTASVLREYNALKLRVLTDSSFTVRDFIEQWLSPWKNAHGIQGKDASFKGAVSFAKKYLGEAAAQQMDAPARSFAITMHNTSDSNILSPHEYLAEQFARYAFSKRLLEKSAFGTKEFFEGVFVKLRAFFTEMKKTQVIKPGVEFSKWVDGLTRLGKNGGNDTVPRAPIETAVVAGTPKGKRRMRVAQTPEGSVAVPVDELPAIAVNVAGLDFNLTRNAEGEYYQVDGAGLLTGGGLGTNLPAAKSALAAAVRLNTAQAASGKTKLKPLAPSVLPPARDGAKVIEVLAPEKTEAHLQAERILRTDEMLQDLRMRDRAEYNELVELVRQGKLDEFKYEALRYVDDETAGKMLWDVDNAEHTEYRNIATPLERVLPKESGLKSFLAYGLRNISDHKWYTMTLSQMAFAMPHIPGLQMLEEQKNKLKTFQSRMKFRAVENAGRWAKMGKEQMGLMERAMKQEHASGQNMFDLTVVNKTWRFMPNADTQAYARKNNIDADTMKLWLDVKNSYLQHMNSLQSALQRKLQDRLALKPMTLKKKSIELAQMFDAIRQRPFLPQTRFGEWALQVREKTILGDRIVHVEFFESETQRNAARATLSKALTKDQQLEPSRYAPTSGLLRVLPVELISTFADEFNLTEKQRKELRGLADVVTLNRETRKYSMQLANVTGANKDLLRGYADFMAHDSNQIAKLYFREQFFKAQRLIEEQQSLAQNEQDFESFDELQKALDFAKDYTQHMLNPAQEYHALRSFVVVKMLWGNIKTALANINSLYNSWALAATQQGTVKGSMATGGTALRVLSSSLQNVGNRIMRQPVEGGQVFSPDERFALNQAKVDGLLDETFAAQLAGFANNGILDRLNMSETKRNWDKIVWAGMVPQHAVENFTRRVTLLMQFNGYRKSGLDNAAAYNRATQDLYALQGDNSQANRPAFMRGPKSLFFIFYGFMQQQLYLMSGAQERARNLQTARNSPNDLGLTEEQLRKKYYKRNYVSGETTKMWMAYGAMAGLMGLPGAEDLDKILGLVAKKMFGNTFSLKDYAYKMGSEISQQAAEYGLAINPRSIVHGASSNVNVFGLLPGVDISSSMGLGSVLPGAGGIDRIGERGGLGDVLVGLMGPFGSIFKDMQKAFSDDPSTLNRMGIVLPNTIKGIGKAIVEHENGVQYPSGGRVTFDREKGEIRDLTTGETLARLMGFMPEIISSNRELHWMQKDKSDYWIARRNGLTAKMWEAHKQGDREAIADVEEAIREFNVGAAPGLRLSSADVRKSMAKRKVNLKRDEAREASSKRYRGIYEEVENDFTGQGD